jgi:hypothetical protein
MTLGGDGEGVGGTMFCNAYQEDYMRPMLSGDSQRSGAQIMMGCAVCPSYAHRLIVRVGDVIVSPRRARGRWC